MWMYEDKEFTSEMIDDNLGFVYEITDTRNGMLYIGKKKFIFKVTKPPLKGKKRKRKSLKESDWQTYYGSSNEVKALVEECGAEIFERKIIKLCKSAGELSYWELYEQMIRHVLYHPEKYYNAFVGGKIHRNHVLKKNK
jgi:hypothetical protein